MVDPYEKLLAEMPRIAKAVNAFGSEAVQQDAFKQLIQAIGHEVPQPNDGKAGLKGARATAKGRPKERSAGGEAREARTRKGRAPSSRLGPAPVLNDLIQGGFFSKPQTIGSIIEHCTISKAKTFKPNELSGTLTRLTRSGTLRRKKNADGNYEYTKP